MRPDGVQCQAKKWFIIVVFLKMDTTPSHRTVVAFERLYAPRPAVCLVYLYLRYTSVHGDRRIWQPGQNR